jgi:hypothetical protein
MRLLIVSALLLLTGACSQANVLEKFASPQDQALAKSYIDQLRQHHYEDIESAMDPSLAGPSLHATLVGMANLFPKEEPTSLTLVGAQQMHISDSSTVNLTFEYGFGGKWVVTNVAVRRQGKSTTIVGFHVAPQPASLEQQNKFTLRGKSPLQYCILFLTIILPLCTLYALVICLKTKFRGRKWPWVLLILFGVGKFWVNWTTGQWGFASLSAQLFSASAIAPLYGPWTLAISLPLGAILFFLRRKGLSAPVAIASD